MQAQMQIGSLRLRDPVSGTLSPPQPIYKSVSIKQEKNFFEYTAKFLTDVFNEFENKKPTDLPEKRVDGESLCTNIIRN